MYMTFYPQAVFEVDGANADIALDDPDFWSKWAARAV
jgi:hypothetical protein